MRPGRAGVAAAAVAAGVLIGVAGCAGPRPLHVVRAKGHEAMQVGDYERAYADFREYVDRMPDDAAARYDLGTVLAKMNRPKEAREQFNTAFDLKPTNDDYADALAQAMHEAGATEDLYAFLRGRCESPGRPRDYLRLGRYAMLSGDVDEAERALLTAARLDRGRSAEYHLALADFYESVSDVERAKQRLRYALYLRPKDEAIQARIRAMGEVPGPTFAMQPEEW